MQKVAYSPALIESWFQDQSDTKGVTLDFSKEEIHFTRMGSHTTGGDSLDYISASFPRTDEGMADLLVQLKGTGLPVPEFDTFVTEVLELPETTVVSESDETVVEETSTVTAENQEVPSVEESPSKVKNVLSKTGKYLGMAAGVFAIGFAIYEIAKHLGPEETASGVSKLLS